MLVGCGLGVNVNHYRGPKPRVITVIRWVPPPSNPVITIGVPGVTCGLGPKAQAHIVFIIRWDCLLGLGPPAQEDTNKAPGRVTTTKGGSFL